MKFPVNTTAVLAVIVLSLGVVRLITPLPGLSRLSPEGIFLVGVLLALRYISRRQTGKREEILKAVPQRPLGLDQ